MAAKTPEFNLKNLTGKNKVINGDMVIDQRTGGAALTISDGSFALDRWTHRKVNAAVATVQKVTDSLPAEFSNALKINVTTADASVAAGDYASIDQRIEGLNVSDLNFGKSNAKTITISFWVRATKIGTNCVVLLNSAANRTYVAEYTIAVSNTWEYKTVTIVGDTAGTWLVDNGIGLVLRFSLMVGTTFQQTAGAWSTIGTVGSPNQTNHMDTIGNTFYITGVQLEKGSTASTYENLTIGEKIRACQRYYEKSYDTNIAPQTATALGARSAIGATSANGANAIANNGVFTVIKRTTPTVTIISPDGTVGTIWRASDDTNTGQSGIIAQNISPTGYRYIGGTITAIAGLTFTYHFTADAEL